MIKVLIADDHPIVRRGVREVLSEAGDVLVGGEAESAPEVRQRVLEERWDVIVLDISLRGGNGLELIPEIRRERPEVGILVLTVYSEPQYAVRAIRAGAAGFLTKEAIGDKLIDAVRKIAGGGRYITPDVAETLASTLAGETAGQPHERLSDRELQILTMIGSGKTVSQIASELHLSVKTISTHRTRILKKMGMKTNAELTHYAVHQGLC